MIEWLFFLLPLAAISGWFAARKHYKKVSKSSQNTFSPDYFKGLNYLLNEQPDKAIDVFIHLLEVNSETVETHFALANLFRRRGETERAIRIHQNLIARPTLTSQQRNHSLVELGLDYMNAGVLDRAEHLFMELLTKTPVPSEAYRQLLKIYQQEKKWMPAIEMATHLQAQSSDNLGDIIAQFYCELAEQQVKHSPNQVASSLKKAQAADPNCVRASLLEAQREISLEQHKKAVKTLLHIERQNIDYLPEALPLLLKSYQQINNLAAFDAWLRSLLDRHPNMTSARLTLTKVIQLKHGSKAAQDYLHQQLHQYPSVEGLHDLIDLSEQSKSTPELVPLIKDITHTMIFRGHRYSCQHCGFSGKTMHWQCPSCKHWSSMKPTEIHLSSLESLLEQT